MVANRRNNQRWPELFQPNGAVRAEQGRFSARILDQSAQGLAIAVPESVAVQPGEKLYLRSERGVTEAQVAYAAPTGDEVRVGLMRIHDFTRDEFSGLTWTLGFTPAATRTPWARKSVLVSATVWTLCAISITAIGLMLYQHPAIRPLLHRWFGL